MAFKVELIHAFLETSRDREQGVRCDDCCSVWTVMMMNSQPIPRALIEHVPLFMYSEDDTDAFTAESFREFISKDTQLFVLLCTQIKLLRLALNYLSYFLKAHGCDVFGETN